jgi:hypothetical protein
MRSCKFWGFVPSDDVIYHVHNNGTIILLLLWLKACKQRARTLRSVHGCCGSIYPDVEHVMKP